ncbi:MAG: hypothetical protein AAGC64_11485 [Bacteroidota bacterium]
MDNRLMYLGVTHESASVEDRSYFAFDKAQREKFIHWLKEKVNITAISIIATCNRTEIYFESASAMPSEVRNLLLIYVENLHGVKLCANIFQVFDCTIETVNHLVHVANGLRSAVVGDKQIINQVKESYQEALKSQNQGSLLERAFQVVFRSHKRIVKESTYLHGSTSIAYSSLKLVASFFGRDALKKLSVLIIGAGEIAQDVLKYLSKFDFREIATTNRTASKVAPLVDRYGISSYDWQRIEINDFNSFDVIISAVSNRKNLIRSVDNSGKKRLWIDLAMPSNISEEISNHCNHIYNIDEIASLVCETSKTQLEAIPCVENIIEEELKVYADWLKKDKIRSFLKAYKHNSKVAFLKLVPKTVHYPISDI